MKKLYIIGIFKNGELMKGIDCRKLTESEFVDLFYNWLLDQIDPCFENFPDGSYVAFDKISI